MGALNGRQKSAYTPLRRLADAWVQTPAPPESFRYRDIPEPARGAFDSLLDKGGIVETVERDHLSDGGSYIHRYRWSKEAWEAIQNALEGRYEPCPCGHSGLSNEGTHYECAYDGCDRAFERDELEVDG